MTRTRKQLPILEEVTITDVAAEGKSIARVNDMVVFIPYGAPGDVVNVKLDKKKKNFAEGHIDRLISPSTIRVTPPCEHFGVCGGCKWQHLPYESQLHFKQKQVKDALERIAKIKIPEIRPILGSSNIWEYRNKMEYTFSNRCWLTFEQLNSEEQFHDRNAVGFHIPGAFDKVLDIHKCHLQDDLSNRLRNFLREYAKEKGYSFYDLKAQHGLLRTMMVRITSIGQTMLLVSFGENDNESINDVMQAIKNKFPDLTSLLYVVNTKANDTFADLDIET